MVRRDVCRTYIVPGKRIAGIELRVEPQLQGEGNVASVVGRSIRPHQVRSHMECPGFGVGADAAILHRRHYACRSRMVRPESITVEEGQIERLVEIPLNIAIRRKRNERVRLSS